MQKGWTCIYSLYIRIRINITLLYRSDHPGTCRGRMLTSRRIAPNQIFSESMYVWKRRSGGVRRPPSATLLHQEYPTSDQGVRGFLSQPRHMRLTSWILSRSLACPAVTCLPGVYARKIFSSKKSATGQLISWWR